MEFRAVTTADYKAVCSFCERAMGMDGYNSPEQKRELMINEAEFNVLIDSDYQLHFVGTIGDRIVALADVTLERRFWAKKN